MNAREDLNRIKWGGWAIAGSAFCLWAGWLSLLAIANQADVAVIEERQRTHKKATPSNCCGWR